MQCVTICWHVVTVLIVSAFCDIFLWNKIMFNSKVILK